MARILTSRISELTPMARAGERRLAEGIDFAQQGLFGGNMDIGELGQLATTAIKGVDVFQDVYKGADMVYKKVDQLDRESDLKEARANAAKDKLGLLAGPPVATGPEIMVPLQATPAPPGQGTGPFSEMADYAKSQLSMNNLSTGLSFPQTMPPAYIEPGPVTPVPAPEYQVQPTAPPGARPSALPSARPGAAPATRAGAPVAREAAPVHTGIRGDIGTYTDALQRYLVEDGMGEEQARDAAIMEIGKIDTSPEGIKQMRHLLEMDINDAAKVADITDINALARSSTQADWPKIKRLAREVIRRGDDGGFLNLVPYTEELENVYKLIPRNAGKKGVKFDLKEYRKNLERGDKNKQHADKMKRRGKGGTPSKKINLDDYAPYVKEGMRGGVSTLVVKNLKELSDIIEKDNPGLSASDLRTKALKLHRETKRVITRMGGGKTGTSYTKGLISKLAPTEVAKTQAQARINVTTANAALAAIKAEDATKAKAVDAKLKADKEAAAARSRTRVLRAKRKNKDNAISRLEKENKNLEKNSKKKRPKRKEKEGLASFNRKLTNYKVAEGKRIQEVRSKNNNAIEKLKSERNVIDAKLPGGK